MIGLEDYKILLKAIEDLRMKSGKAIIVVEGKRDRLALRSLGVKGEILEISNMPNSVLADTIGEKEAIILTDWDERGERILKQIEKVVEFKDLTIRRKIKAVTGKYIHSVEELPIFIEKVEETLKK